jgi:transcriptional regulator with XRE-family HTH domain
VKASPGIGKLVLGRRIERGLGQEQLARLCGCTLRTIQRIESGATESVSTRIIRGLNRALGISLRDLVGTERGGAR